LWGTTRAEPSASGQALSSSQRYAQTGSLIDSLSNAELENIQCVKHLFRSILPTAEMSSSQWMP